MVNYWSVSGLPGNVVTAVDMEVEKDQGADLQSLSSPIPGEQDWLNFTDDSKKRECLGVRTIRYNNFDRRVAEYGQT